MNHRLTQNAAWAGSNSKAYAIGALRPGGFYIRRVVWGRLAAMYERRLGEEIRRAIVLVEKGKLL